MTVSVIIVNFNVKYFLDVCLHSVAKAALDIAAEIIVVDNNSSDGSLEMLAERHPLVKVIANSDNRGFSAANNQGVAVANGRYILFLNPDTVVPEDFFVSTIAYMDAHPNAGSLGPRIIDGKGRFAPDSKKSFPTLAVAFYKTTGIGRLFRSSAYFNRYYAVHIGEHECASVEVLSGCCMLVRRSVIQAILPAFDEDYFMYCEDVDLCFRIQQAGFRNIYFPAATIIHYKGESTRKMTMAYVRVFNDALITFVRKHYNKKQARLFVTFINAGIMLRMVSGGVKRVLKVLRMPLLDALLLAIVLFGMMVFWVDHVRNVRPIPLASIYATFPVYILLWVVSLYLNAAYDEQYRALRVVRGMLIGTVVILAYYGLLPPHLRYSRGLIVFTALTGTVVMLGMHELLHRLGILKYIPYDQVPRKAVIVAGPAAYDHTASLLRQVHYAPSLQGRISAGTDEGDDVDALAQLAGIKQFLYTAGIDEVIFCINGLSYSRVLTEMQTCGDQYDYKIHLPNSRGFVGSNSSNTAGDHYTTDYRYNLYSFAQLRNKRLLDVVLSVFFLLTSPVLIFIVHNPMGFIRNCLHVLVGWQSWVGYAGAPSAGMPPLKRGVLPPYNLLPEYHLPATATARLDNLYAREYMPATDLQLIVANIRYLGRAQR